MNRTKIRWKDSRGQSRTNLCVPQLRQSKSADDAWVREVRQPVSPNRVLLGSDGSDALFLIWA